MPRTPSPPPAWYLLVHQLPPRPLYLRAKIRRRLTRVGAIAIKNSVYVLPERNECLEDLQWIAQEAVAGGGEAYVCRAEFIEGVSAAALRERFIANVTARYEPLKAKLDGVLRQVRRHRGRVSGPLAARLLSVRRQVHEIHRADFFDSAAGREVETIMTAIDRARSAATSRSRTRQSTPPTDLVGRVWVTRRDPHIDRLATAWLIRRFVDPAARFRFVDPTGGTTRAGEVSFDMTGGDFTHEGDRCSFETMLARLDLADPALAEIGEIVHDLDLKDGKFGRADAQGIHQLVQGLVQAHSDSATRITQALPVFDTLYQSFGGRTPSPARSTRSKPRRAASSRRRARKAAR